MIYLFALKHFRKKASVIKNEVSTDLYINFDKVESDTEVDKYEWMCSSCPIKPYWEL